MKSTFEPLDFRRRSYLLCFSNIFVVYSTEVESRTQGSRPRPRTQKNPRSRTAFPRTNPFVAKNRNARGQGQGLRTQALVFSKKKSLKIFFRQSPK